MTDEQAIRKVYEEHIDSNNGFIAKICYLCTLI